LEPLIPEKYRDDFLDFLISEKYGSVTFQIQKGVIIGCDITEKQRRIADRNTEAKMD